MAQTPSNMIALGTIAPKFELLDTISNSKMKLDNLKGSKGTVIAFICNHCPFVVHINEEFVKIANQYQKKGIGFITISSNDIEKYPQDGPVKMHLHAVESKFSFPYLFDETQEIAKAYDAACTPDIYLFNHDLKLVYRGQFDDSRPGNNINPTGNDLKNAIDCLLSQTQNNQTQKPSIGCNIKWK
jgi:peroxiredoxin